ncbi:MAG: crossover junction endodeoxyribonuclease RuvC [Bradymonadales bacterium]|nr:MAG: crossover junction endodeoxyribonuclease RuvC [Bradymonadales bacterium]
MILLAIDPGSLKTGFAIMKQEAGRLVRLSSGALFLDAQQALPQRLVCLAQDIEELIQKYKPTELAIEKTFFAKNAQSALTLGQARGVLILKAAEHRLEIFEYSATQVKSSLCGSGRASKDQIAFMVRQLLKLPKTFEFSGNDEADALAIGLTHGQTRGKLGVSSHDRATSRKTSSKDSNPIRH